MRATIYRLCLRHRTAAKIILGAFLCIVYSCLLSWLNAPLWTHPLLWLVLLFVNSVGIDSLNDRLLRPLIKQMDEQCDPYPFLLELEEQATYSFPESMRLVHHVNHAMALSEIGEFERAIEILREVNIDQLTSTTLPMKCIYYNNLTSHLHNAGQYDEAEIGYAQTLQIYSDLPENRLKKRLSHAIESATADALFRKGEYREAISLLDRITPQSQRHRVGLALLYARCAIRLDDVETAQAKLQFVLQHGNRLYCVEEAGRMIETLS